MAETAKVETCAVVKANFNTNFNVYWTFQMQKRWKIVAVNAVQCLVRYNVHFEVSGLG